MSTSDYSTVYDGVFDISQLPRTAGYMYKKGGTVNSGNRIGGGRRNWKKRYFIINSIEYRGKEAYELQYYDAPNGKLKGSIGLFDIEVYCETKSHHRNVKYEFQILMQNSGVLQLSVDDANEREEWIESLNMIISYLRKVLMSSGYSLNGYDPYFEDEENCYNLGEEISQLCNAFGPGLVGAEAGQKSHFLIQINDINGNPTKEGGMPITATISDDDHLYYIKIIDNKDGTYSGFYTLGSPGIYDLHIRLNDEHDIQGSPFTIEIFASKTVPEFCVAEGDSLHQVTVDSISYFTILSRDTYSNSKTNGGDPFEVSIVGPAHVNGLIDNNDGSYTCSFIASDPSDMNSFSSASLVISVTLFGKHISGSPFHPTIILSQKQILSPNSNIYNRPSKVLTEANMSKVKPSIELPQQSQVVSKLEVLPPVESLPPPPLPPVKITVEDRAIAVTKEVAKIEAVSGVPLSRLERARQRALITKKLIDEPSIILSQKSDSETKSPSKSKPVVNLSDNKAQKPEAVSTYNRNARSDVNPITGLPYKSEKSVAISEEAKTNKDKITTRKAEGISKPSLNNQLAGDRVNPTNANSIAPIVNQAKNGTGMVTVLGLSQNDVESVVISLNSGLIGSVQSNQYTEEDKIMWDLTHQALTSPEV